MWLVCLNRIFAVGMQVTHVTFRGKIALFKNTFYILTQHIYQPNHTTQVSIVLEDGKKLDPDHTTYHALENKRWNTTIFHT